jgi:predicted DNA-binding transcriptional regulator AlpA
MQPRFIRIRELATTPGRAGLLPVSPATLWRWVARGEFPKPVRLGPQVTAWPIEEVQEFLRAKGGAK